jgi:hypothetical protein
MTTLKTGLAALLALALFGGPVAAQNATPRPARKAFAVFAPVVVQMTFPSDDSVPEPMVAAAFQAAAQSFVPQVRKNAKNPDAILTDAQVKTMLQRLQSGPTDLYATQKQSPKWSAPAQTLKDKSGAEVALLAPLETLKNQPDSLTPFRYRWPDGTQTLTGLATAKDGTVAALSEKGKALMTQSGATLLLFCQVTGVDVKQSVNLKQPSPTATTQNYDFPLIPAPDLPLDLIDVTHATVTVVTVQCMAVMAQTGQVLFQQAMQGGSAWNGRKTKDGHFPLVSEAVTATRHAAQNLLHLVGPTATVYLNMR